MSFTVQLDGNGRPVMVPDDGAQAGDETGAGDVNLALLGRTMVHPVAAAPAAQRPPAAPPKAPRAADMVRDIKARLRVVNAEIRARKSLEREREQLQRLLTAATTKSAPVRALRSAG